MGAVTCQGRLFASTDHYIYGLKQSRRQWAGLLVETVVEFGMEQSRTDPCVFRIVVNGKIELIMAVHVDDIVIAGSNEACRDFHAALNNKCPASNLVTNAYLKKLLQRRVNMVYWFCFQA